MALAPLQAARRSSRWLVALGLVLGTSVGAAIALGPIPALGASVLSGLVAVAALALRHPSYLNLEFPAFLILATTVSFRIRTAEQLASNPLDAQGIFRLACNVLAIGLALNVLLLSERRAEAGPLTTRPARLYCLYAVVATAGVMTSVLPLLTGYRVMELIAPIVVVAAAFKDRGRAGLETIKSMLYWYFVVLVGWVWIGFAVFPSQALDRVPGPIPFRIHGVYPWVSSNALGTMGVVLFFWSMAKFLSPEKEGGPRRSVSLSIAGLGFISLIAAQYRTGYVAFVAVGLLLLVLRRKKLLVAIAAALTVGVVLFVPAIAGSVTPVILRGADFETAGRLSGRITWWKLAIPVWQEKPLIGGGLQTATRFEVLAANKHDVSNIHSGWVEALVGTGIIGVAFLAGSLLTAVRRATAEALKPGGRLAPILLLALIAVRSLTGGGFEQGGDTALLYLAIIWGLPDPQKEAVTPTTSVESAEQ
jgi:O-antigen ligase